MRGNRKKDTRPERALRSAVHRRGLRFRVDYPLRLAVGRPIRLDIAFTRLRVAVFVDGCFWHRCPDHCAVPRSNRIYWEAKLSRNVERDRRIDEALEGARWVAVHVWEHEDVELAAERIAAVVARRASELPSSRSEVLR